MGLRYRLSGVAVLAGLSLLTVGASPALASSPAGGFADASGLVVDVTALAGNVALPGPLTGTPLDPNTLARASQNCPPTNPKVATSSLIDQSVPVVAPTIKTLATMAGANCAKPTAVASAETQGVAALALAPTVPIPGLPTGALVTADLLLAQANSSCTAAPNGAGSQFVGLTIAGQAVPADPPPNTRIDIPGVATVIVNEQHPSATGRGIVVNAVHIIGASALLRGDIIISHAVSGVVCPNGAGSAFVPPLVKPDISFTKNATPSTAHPGDTVTYTATVTNTSAQACDVLRLVDHLDPAFTLVSTSGGFGTKFDSPAPTRSDGGTDAVLRPTTVSLAAGKSLTQTFVVKLKSTVQPGTYYNNLEMFCSVNGDFASGPLAPVTVPATVVPISAGAPPQAPAAAPPGQLAYTGGAPLVAGLALLLLGAAVVVRRFATRG